LSLTI